MDARDFEIELRGYNKDEVDTYISELETEYSQKLSRIEAKSREMEKQTEDLKRRPDKKERQKEQLEREIETKYRTYIDNYDKIAGLVYESQLKADRIIAEANSERDAILQAAHEEEQRILAEANRVLEDAKTQEKLMLDDADVEAKRRVDAVAGTVDRALADGRTRYADIQVQIRGLIETLEEAQRRFEKGCAETQKIFDLMPETIDRFTDEESDFDEDDPDEEYQDSLDPESL